MGVRSKQLGGTNNIGTTSTLCYTVESGETTLLKSISLYNRHATATAVVTIGRGTAGVTNNGTMFRVSMPPSTHAYIECWIVLAAGATVSAISDTATAVSMYMSGAELEGAAD